MGTVEERRATLRRRLERRGISDPRVLAVIEQLPRDRFVPPELEPQAYEDEALPIAGGQTISQPYIVALMTEALRLEGDETVLEIGTGSGYQTAILSRLAGRVITIERHAELMESARNLLTGLACTNVALHLGDGTQGWPDDAPYDAVIVTAAAPQIPEPLYQQTKTGGRIVIPVGDERHQDLQLVTRDRNGPRLRSLCGCRFVKLIGSAGWPE